MKVRTSLALLFLLVFSVSGSAQEPASAAESAEKLRSQLMEVQEKENALRTRAAQLEESIKPENIERSLAGIGSTRPEELRESRRRQLSIQLEGVNAQLRTLESSRLRLEAALANADALAYQQSARPVPTQMMAGSSFKSYHLVLLGSGGLAVLALGGGALWYRKKRR